MMYFDNGFILFGGYKYGVLSKIARLDLVTTAWTDIGNLKSGRYVHNVIFDGEVFMVIGGNEGELKTEKCSLSGGRMTCTEQSPILEYYSMTPALFMVPEDFCTEL